jgi:undecaprenyl-diphosphatase
MDTLHAIILGIVQGLSEFLPISSSGHLLLVQWALGWDDFEDAPALERAFSVAVHLGTLAAVLFYFRADVVRLVRSGVGEVARRQPLSTDGRLAWLLLLSALPAAVVGFVLDDLIGAAGERIWLIGVMLIVFGLVLAWADARNGTRQSSSWTPRQALLMGCAQALALQPGVSRSGATMTVALALGYQRTEAARLAFLMSIPVIAGAGGYEFAGVLGGEGVAEEFRSAFALGFVSAVVTGWAAIWLTLRIVRTRTFRPFVIYRVVVGVAVLVAVVAGVR